MGSADSVRNVATGEHGSRRGSPSTSAARPGSPPSPRLWVALAVGLGIVSTTLGVLVVKRLNDAAMAKEDPGRKMDIIAVRDLVSSLEGRLAGAEKDLQRLQPPAAPPQATLEAQPERPAADRASPLDQRIGAMERRLAEIGEVQLAQAREPAKIDVAGQKYDPAMIPT